MDNGSHINVNDISNPAPQEDIVSTVMKTKAIPETRCDESLVVVDGLHS